MSRKMAIAGFAVAGIAALLWCALMTPAQTDARG